MAAFTIITLILCKNLDILCVAGLQVFLFCYVFIIHVSLKRG